MRTSNACSRCAEVVYRIESIENKEVIKAQGSSKIVGCSFGYNQRESAIPFDYFDCFPAFVC